MAVNTQKLVNIVMAVIVGFATVFSIMAVIAGWFLLREKQQRELQAEKKTNLRLEQYNVQLTQANDEMRRAQDAAAEALQSAERASKAKTDFLSNMSHDIRTPMNAIIGITTLMKNELHEPEKLAEHLGKLESSGQLLLGIINNILDMSRIESGKTTLHVEKMNLSQQISQLDSIIRQQAGQRSQTFTVSTNLQHENVLADPNRLNQVLMNILYQNEGGKGVFLQRSGKRHSMRSFQQFQQCNQFRCSNYRYDNRDNQCNGQRTPPVGGDAADSVFGDLS